MHVFWLCHVTNLLCHLQQLYNTPHISITLNTFPNEPTPSFYFIHNSKLNFLNFFYHSGLQKSIFHESIYKLNFPLPLFSFVLFETRPHYAALASLKRAMYTRVPQTHSDSPVSGFPVLRLKACTALGQTLFLAARGPHFYFSFKRAKLLVVCGLTTPENSRSVYSNL